MIVGKIVFAHFDPIWEKKKQEKFILKKLLEIWKPIDFGCHFIFSYAVFNLVDQSRNVDMNVDI